MTSTTRLMLGVLLWLVATACASGPSGGPAAAPTPAALPETRGFAGGTRVQGGFTNQASAVLDSVIPAAPATVWSAMPGVFQILEIDTPTVERASYTIGEPGARVPRIAGSRRLSQYLDCGTGIGGANADNYEVTLQLLVRLSPASADATVVRTTLDAYARPRDSAGEPIHCASEGTLERQVLSLISRQLAMDELTAAGASQGTVAGAASPAAAGTSGGASSGSVAPASMSAGRLPVTGDLVQIECRADEAVESLRGRGFYVGAGTGTVRILMDRRGRTVAVPAVNVRRIQVRERRSYAALASLVGFVAGAALGGLYASSRYDPDADYHFRPEVVITVGAVAGGMVGGFLGRIGGSFVHSDTWHDVPAEWALRTSGVDLVPASSSPTGSCPAF